MKKLLFLLVISVLIFAGCKQNKPINKCFVFNGKGDSVAVQIKYDTVDAIRPSWLKNDSNNWYEKQFAKGIIPVKKVNSEILIKIPILIRTLTAICKASCKYPLTFAPIKNDSIHVYFIRATVERPSEYDAVNKVDSMQIANRTVSMKLDSVMEAQTLAGKLTWATYLKRSLFIEDSITKQTFKDSVIMMDSFKNELPTLLTKFKKDSIALNKDSCQTIQFEWMYSCTNAMGVPGELKITIEYSPYTLKEIPYSKEITSDAESEDNESN